jgi:hypothetical protein
MANINRAVGPAWNIWAEHTDSLSQRDTGWMQFYAATVQEVYDTILMSYKLAEKVYLPAMVCFDGFILSHAIQPLEVTQPGDFIPPIDLPYALDTLNPMSYGNLTGPNDYFKFRRAMQDSMKEAGVECRAIEKEFAERFGRKYAPVMEYRTGPTVATLYTAVEGRLPFLEDDTVVNLTTVLHDPPSPTRQAGRLQPLLTRLLVKDPGERPDHAAVQALLAEVGPARDHATVSDQPSC